MNVPGENRSELVAAYLLGELDEAERERFERRLAEEPELRAETEAMSPVVSRLEGLPDDGWDPPQPPPLALPVDEIPGGARTGVAERTSASRRRWGFALAAGFACVAVAAALWIGLASDEPSGETVQLAPLDSEPEPARGELTLPQDGGEARLTVGGLGPSDGDFYEVWLLGRGDRLVSLGSFRVGESGEAELEIQLPVDSSSYEYFDVSREPDDGDPAHSGDSILRGPTVS
jgi:anti-sigma-K factor RskA